MSTAQFRITYDGPALSNGEMDVRELAPALLAVSGLLKAANKALQGDRADVRVNVRGSFKTGSFGIDFIVAQDLLQNIKDIFASDSAAATANALAILSAIGVAGGGLIGLLRKLRGRTPEKIEAADQNVILHIESERLVVEREVYVLFADRDTRNQLGDTLKPMDGESIDKVAFGTDNDIAEVITSTERAWFAAPDPLQNPLHQSHGETLLVIQSAVFTEGNKWRFTDGASSFHAEIADAEFNQRVQSGSERFGNGDVLLVTLEKRQYEGDGKLKVDYRVLKVIEHRAPLQTPLL
ncbi:hypothetical protein [Panacagrimonas sp.]|uniref:hypothetical protein n=1 Tax=Panacagrimonas sp. TaxID=2480088 RepID=UPI003B526092